MSQPTALTTPESAMMPSPIAGLPQSSRPVRMQSHGRLSRQARSRATKPCGRRNTWVARSGDDGADTTVEAASKPMHCVKLLGQRLMARDFDRQVAEFQIRVAVLNGFTTLGIPVIKVTG